jgi:hypothetical protein
MPYIRSPSGETVTLSDKASCLQLQVGLAVGHRARMLRSRGGHLRHASVPQDQYLFRPTLRLSPIGRAEDYRERETSEIRRRSGGSGPPLRMALQISKLPGMFPEFVAGRLDESQPPIPSPKLAFRKTLIVQPSLIVKLCRAVWTSGPRQRWNGVDDKANVLCTSRFFEAIPQGCHARIIDLYGGPIRPRLLGFRQLKLYFRFGIRLGVLSGDRWNSAKPIALSAKGTFPTRSSL